MNNQPKKTSGDTAHTLAKAVLSAVPAIGGPLSVLFESVFTEPIEKRKQEWLARLALSIDLLTKKINDLTTERLSKDQVFISVAFHASQVALRCHQAEKLEALQHAVTNTAIDKEIDEIKIMMFIRFIDEFTPLHLQVLQFNYEPIPPKRQPESHEWRQAMEWAWNQANPELLGQTPLVRQMMADLFTRGLVNTRGLDQGPDLKKGTSEFGEEFLRFITDPFER